MRRFSQRNSLVTLSDINITPLLDLAFVLLIIFIIISPSIRSKQDHSMDLTLPKGGGPSRKVDPKNVSLIEIAQDGSYRLNLQPADLPTIERVLVSAFRANPELIVKVRADEQGKILGLAAILDLCQWNGIPLSMDTRPVSR